MNFPKRHVMPDGSVYTVTFEQVKADWADVVAQFDDLTAEQKAGHIDRFDDGQAQEWYAQQWEACDVTRCGTATGELDENVRSAALRKALHGAKGWASDYEQPATQEQAEWTI